MKFNDVIFIHIPRTGGTYIESLLCKKYNVNINWPDVNNKNLFGLKKLNDYNYLTLQHLTLNEMVKYNYFEDTWSYEKPDSYLLYNYYRDGLLLY